MVKVSAMIYKFHIDQTAMSNIVLSIFIDLWDGVLSLLLPLRESSCKRLTLVMMAAACEIDSQ